MNNINLENTASIKLDPISYIAISNAFQCLCALVKMQFEYAKLENTYKIEIDEQKEIIWIKKK